MRDVIQVLQRRCPRIALTVFGVKVQGDGAAEEVADAMAEMGKRDFDVLMVVRGGGSLEDLWSFNEEIVARAVVASPIPVISGVGHETDFTICDFVADLRAPTPSAAAEMASRPDAEWEEEIVALGERLESAVVDLLEESPLAWGSEVVPPVFFRHTLEEECRDLGKFACRLPTGVREPAKLASARPLWWFPA